MKEIKVYKNILTEFDDSIKQYFKDVSKLHIYSGDEQVELARKAKAGDELAREKLLNSNLRFVITCAKQYVNQGVPLIDLIEAGNYGLLLSLNNYDPDRGYKFLSFAVWYIRREIIKAIYNTGRTIRYPITYISKITKVKKAYDDFVSKYSREPSDEELINLTNLTQKQYDSVVMDKSYCQSLETPISEDGNTTIEDTIANEPSSMSDTFVKETIHKALNILNPREYKVITEFYGLEGQYDRPIKEIAKDMDVGEERVRQIRKGAVKKLKNRYGNILKTLL